MYVFVVFICICCVWFIVIIFVVGGGLGSVDWRKVCNLSDYIGR